MGAEALVKGWVPSPLSATVRKEGGLVLWKEVDDMPSFMRGLGRGEKGGFMGWE